MENDECRIRYLTRHKLKKYEFSVLAYGDSLTAGYCNAGFSFSSYALAIEEAAPNILCDHTGYSGWTAREMVISCTLPLTLTSADREGYKYDLAIIMAGTNDLVCFDQDQIAQDLWNLHQSAHEQGVPTIAISIPESHAQTEFKLLADAASAVNNKVEERCNQEALATFVKCPIPYDQMSGNWEEDGLHMSFAGYDALGQALVPHVLRVLQGRG